MLDTRTLSLLWEVYCFAQGYRESDLRASDLWRFSRGLGSYLYGWITNELPAVAGAPSSLKQCRAEMGFQSG